MKIAMITLAEKVHYIRCFFGLLKPDITELPISSRLDLVQVQMPRIPKHRFFEKRRKKYEKKLDQLLKDRQVSNVYYEASGAAQRYLMEHFKEALQKAAKMYKIPLESADIALVCTDTNNQALQRIIDDICLTTRFAVLLSENPEKGEVFSSAIYDNCGYPLFVSRPTASREDFDIAILLEHTDIKIRGKLTFNLTGEMLPAVKDEIIIHSLMIDSDEIKQLKKSGIEDEIIYQIALDCGLQDVKIVDFL